MTQSPCLPELPKLPRLGCDMDGRESNGYDGRDMRDYATAYGLACYEAGSAAAAQAAWRPVATAPHGVRVLLGPREAPVVGIVKHPPEWEEERDPVCSVVHYNGNVFVAGYHCSEWMPLPTAPTQGAEGAAPQAATMCPCGDRPAAQCDEQWGPKCDLGNNEAHVKVYAPAPQAVVGEASEGLWQTVRDVLGFFRLTYWCDADGEGLPLVDHLCRPKARDISDGASELNMLCDDIVAAVSALTPSPTPTAPQEADALREALTAMTADRDRLDALVNSPETRDFLTGVRNEVAHQVERWGTVHDRAKEPADWFWLVGYLGGKALAAHVKGDTEKAMHHCVSTSAALANWHAHIAHGSGLMQPGSSDLQDFLRETFGSSLIEYQADRAALAQHQPATLGETK